MRLHEIFWVLAIGLACINSTLMIICLVKNRIKWFEILVIIPLSTGIPYLIAFIVAQNFSGWKAFGQGVVAAIYTFFSLMVFLSIYLISKCTVQQ